MAKKILLIPIAVLLLLPGAWALFATAAPQIPTTIETKGVAQKCLACHGDYDKLAEKTSNYKASSGETVTPHQYIPHKEKTEIPDCTECHESHPMFHIRFCLSWMLRTSGSV